MGLQNLCHRVQRVSSYDTNQKLHALWKSGRTNEARQLFDNMPQRDEFSWNTMIAAYSDSGNLSEAKKLFDETPKKSAITWSSLITGFCRNGSEFEALELFWQMGFEGYKPSQFTLGSVLRMCSMKCLLSRGEQVHGYAAKVGLDKNDFVVTGLVDMYSKCRRIMEAEYLFGTMANGRNHVSWTAMISGYSQNGEELRAIECFRDMRAEGVECNQYTFPSVFTACAALSACGFGAQVHGCVVRGGFETNVFVESSLVDMYAKCGDFRSAKKALELRETDDVISWNSMIVGCVRHGLKEEALLMFKNMHSKDMEIDDYTFPSVLNSLASMNYERYAKSVHSMIVKTGFHAYKLVGNALMDMYAKRNDLGSAFKVFNSMTDKDVVSWTSLVTGHAHNGAPEEALKLFCGMRIAGIEPDQVVISSVLSSCAELTTLKFGQQVHANYIKSGFGSSLSVDNSLVAMYAKCGNIEDASCIFYLMQIRNVISWTALIVGYAQNGRAKESLLLYDLMTESGIKPDFITFIGLLFACSHAGLAEQAHQYFESMTRIYGIKPGPDHYACMIDLLGRSGKMLEAEKLLDEMDVEPDATVWKALLSACRVHGVVELAERAAEALFKLEPQNSVSYVMLSNIYSAAGKWEDSARIRRLMKNKGISKEPGRSWIEMNSQVHAFTSEDRSHPNIDDIYSKIDEVMRLIKEAGYVPDINYALHDVNEEVKEHGLAYHSEKLAVAFGLLFVPKSAPIRIFKNLRVCGDCHVAMKFISKVFQRHIILRDSNCFHHFIEGKCSCGDYW
ncbi:hypothetical protein DCAR_0522025 [Daucus carota subsp. sativus]|uniref:DYW domain-containing protein n=1 Tax=Daucus carota subsp. sativus TaxID=79200 RepID=A0AAF0X6C7_DAUCS|nr:PREDICTED: pentatricopeptide repeat-containing protein At4g21065 [Daucus carota subsp. sativus]WOH02636.1 hypothetical protein DCAR_0522025 [Daucus carota subsp. sativus]